MQQATGGEKSRVVAKPARSDIQRGGIALDAFASALFWGYVAIMFGSSEIKIAESIGLAPENVALICGKRRRLGRGRVVGASRARVAPVRPRARGLRNRVYLSDSQPSLTRDGSRRLVALVRVRRIGHPRPRMGASISRPRPPRSDRCS